MKEIQFKEEYRKSKKAQYLCEFAKKIGSSYKIGMFIDRFGKASYAAGIRGLFIPYMSKHAFYSEKASFYDRSFHGVTDRIYQAIKGIQKEGLVYHVAGVRFINGKPTLMWDVMVGDEFDLSKRDSSYLFTIASGISSMPNTSKIKKFHLLGRDEDVLHFLNSEPKSYAIRKVDLRLIEFAEKYKDFLSSIDKSNSIDLRILKEVTSFPKYSDALDLHIDFSEANTQRFGNRINDDIFLF